MESGEGEGGKRENSSCSEALLQKAHSAQGGHATRERD